VIKIIRSLYLLPFLALAIRPTVANAAEKTVSAKGYGEDDGAATKDALRVAVGLACGEGITTTSSSSSSSEKQIPKKNRMLQGLQTRKFRQLRLALLKAIN
jgi:hypothetical protein